MDDNIDGLLIGCDELKRKFFVKQPHLGEQTSYNLHDRVGAGKMRPEIFDVESSVNKHLMTRGLADGLYLPSPAVKEW
jgi:hypothetical protein